MPRDVAPEVADLPGVVLVDLATARRRQPGRAVGRRPGRVEAIVADEVEAFLTWLRGADVAPTVAALRARADEVVAAELRRLANRRPDLTDEQRAEVAHAVHRVVQRLLHQPTVRVRQLAAAPGGDQYAAVLRELFDLAVPDPWPTSDRRPERVDVESSAWSAARGTRRLNGRTARRTADVMTLRLGTRGSALALAQSQLVADQVARATGEPVELVEIVTDGDRSAAPVQQLGVGVFVSALRDALHAKEIDFAVHSYKDLPTAPADGLTIAAVPASRRPARRAGRPGRFAAGRARRPASGSAPARRAGSPSCSASGAGSCACRCAATWTPGCARSPSGELDAVVLAAPGCAGLAAPPRSPRSSTRC